MDDLIAEAQRQFAVCNACRYCEGYCAVFPEMERTSLFRIADVAYLANLCHDCRACHQACMFTAPHEFAIDIPAVMTEARLRSWERYTFPRGLAALFRRGPAAVAVATVVATAFWILVTLAAGGTGGLTTADATSGAFYRVVPHALMISVFLLLGALAVGAAVIGGARFLHDTGTGRRALSPRAIRAAFADAAALRNLRGGGGECHFPNIDEPSATRRRAHHLVAGGFLLAFGATIAAAFMENVLGHPSPYPFLSVPVMLGLVGGIATTIGCIVMVHLKLRERRRPADTGARAQEYSFVLALLIVSVTGLALVALRETSAMPLLLAIHLATVTALYVTAPYGRFIHAVYRVTALLVRAAR
jgi:citrate/tricarballylate utilization protein